MSRATWLWPTRWPRVVALAGDAWRETPAARRRSLPRESFLEALLRTQVSTRRGQLESSPEERFDLPTTVRQNWRQFEYTLRFELEHEGLKVAESIEIEGLHHGNAPIPTASRVGPVVASGGIMGMDPADGTIPDDLNRQVELAFANVSAVMNSVGGTVEDIVKFTCFVADRDSRELINVKWLEMFPDEHRRPARHTVAHALPGRVLIQIEILAYVTPNG